MAGTNPIESDADRQALLQAMGEEAVYTPFGGAPVTIDVLFDDSYTDAVRGEASDPNCEARDIDLTGTINKGTIVIRGTTYTIQNKEPDSTGMTTLILKEA